MGAVLTVVEVTAAAEQLTVNTHGTPLLGIEGSTVRLVVIIYNIFRLVVIIKKMTTWSPYQIFSCTTVRSTYLDGLKMLEANIPVFAISGTLSGFTVISINVHTSSIFLVFMVLSMIFLFLSRRTYYNYYDKYNRCHCAR